MSKIQEFFSAGGRRLFDSEKPVVDAFNDKYGRALASAALSQHRAERANPQSDQNARTLAGQVLTNGTRYGEQTRSLVESVLTQKHSSPHPDQTARNLAGRVLTNGARYSEQTRLLAGSVLTQKQSSLHVQRLAASVLGDDKDGRTSQSVSAKARTIRRQSIAAMVTKKLSSQKSR